MEQQIRFCTAPDGVRLAYAVHGSGPPIVRAATWLTHLDFDWESPVWRHWLRSLGEGHTLIRYDERGCGLSDREVGDLSVDTWVADLETVVDAAGLDRFALLGISQGAAVALQYAALHAERVSHLVLHGGFVRGRKLRQPDQRLLHEAMLSAIRAGWADPDPPSVTCSACCSSQTAPRSRWPGTTTCNAARRRPRPPCACTKRAEGST